MKERLQRDNNEMENEKKRMDGEINVGAMEGDKGKIREN